MEPREPIQREQASSTRRMRRTHRKVVAEILREPLLIAIKIVNDTVLTLYHTGTSHLGPDRPRCSAVATLARATVGSPQDLLSF